MSKKRKRDREREREIELGHGQSRPYLELSFDPLRSACITIKDSREKQRERGREEDARRIGRTIDAKVENTEHELLREMVNPLLPTE